MVIKNRIRTGFEMGSAYPRHGGFPRSRSVGEEDRNPYIGRALPGEHSEGLRLPRIGHPDEPGKDVSLRAGPVYRTPLSMVQSGVLFSAPVSLRT